MFILGLCFSWSSTNKSAQQFLHQSEKPGGGQACPVESSPPILPSCWTHLPWHQGAVLPIRSALLAPVPGWLPCLLPVWFHVRMRWPPPQHSSLYFCDCWSPLFGSSPFAGQRTNRCFIFFSGILIYRSSLMLQETLESLCLPPHCGLCPQSDRGGGSSDGVV